MKSEEILDLEWRVDAGKDKISQIINFAERVRALRDKWCAQNKKAQPYVVYKIGSRIKKVFCN